MLKWLEVLEIIVRNSHLFSFFKVKVMKEFNYGPSIFKEWVSHNEETFGLTWRKELFWDPLGGGGRGWN